MFRKVLAAGFCAAVLTLQLIPVFGRIKHNNWYWPFVNYPMYSTPRYPGEAIEIAELTALPCAPSAEPKRLTYRDLGVTSFTYNSMLARAGMIGVRPDEAKASRAREQIVRLAERYARSPVCGLELRTRRFGFDSAGLAAGPPRTEIPWIWHPPAGATR